MFNLSHYISKRGRHRTRLGVQVIASPCTFLLDLSGLGGCGTLCHLVGGQVRVSASYWVRAGCRQQSLGMFLLIAILLGFAAGMVTGGRPHLLFIFSSRRRHTIFDCDWSSDVCSSDLTGVRELGIAALPWDRDARDLQARIEFVRAALVGAQAAQPPWPEVSDAALGATLETWLTPWLDGVTRREHLARVPLTDALRARLTSEQRRALEEWAPASLTMPSGSRIRVDYLDDSAPAGSGGSGERRGGEECRSR